MLKMIYETSHLFTMERSKLMLRLWFSELLGVHIHKDTDIFLCVHGRSKMTFAGCTILLTDDLFTYHLQSSLIKGLLHVLCPAFSAARAPMELDVLRSGLPPRGRRGLGSEVRRRIVRPRGPRAQRCGDRSDNLTQQPLRHGLRSYGRAFMLSCCQQMLRGTTEAVDCLAAPGMLLADASPACDSLSTSSYGAFRVDLIDCGN